VTHAELAQILDGVAVCCLLDDVALDKQLFGLLEESVHFGNEKILELLS